MQNWKPNKQVWKLWHTFTTFHKEKQGAQYNEGFHFFHYSNDSCSITWLKHNVLKTPPSRRLRHIVRRLIDEIVVCMKQSVTVIHLESLKCFLVCREEPSYLYTLHFVEEHEKLFWRKFLVFVFYSVVVRSVMPCFSMKGLFEATTILHDEVHASV